MHDPISDMLIRIKNAQAVRKDAVDFPHSKIKAEILGVLEGSGFIGAAQKKGKKQKKFLSVALLYGKDGRGRVNGVERVSKPSRRVYAGYDELRPVRQGVGLAIISTSKGIMTGKEARKQKIGGEVLFKIW